MKATVHIATSLDGFIARENGGIDWLPNDEDADPGEDYGYQAFMDTVDALVMGRNSYELVLSFGGAWPYEKKPVVVLSSQHVDIPDDIAAMVSSMDAPPREVVGRLAERGYKHLYIDGGKTIQGFLKEGLIQRVIITVIPVLIGKGIPLFGPVPLDIKLRLTESRKFDSGIVQSEYEVLGKDST